MTRVLMVWGRGCSQSHVRVVRYKQQSLMNIEVRDSVALKMLKRHLGLVAASRARTGGTEDCCRHFSQTLTHLL